MATPIYVFVSYSHADEPFKTELEKRLRILANKFPGFLTWSDSCLRIGDTLETAVEIELKKANLFIPLVSPDYLASDFCWKIEYPTASEYRDRGLLSIAPIIIRPCSWKNTALKRLLCFPHDGKPITAWPDRDQAWLDVENALLAKCEEIAAGKAATPSAQPSTFLTLAPIPSVSLRTSGCAEMLPPIEFTLDRELLREDYGDIQLFFSTNFTSRLLNDPISECYATIESDGLLSSAARTFDTNGVQNGANSILFRSFPLYLLRTDGSHHRRVSVRHARINRAQLGPSASVSIAVQIKNQQGEWLTQGDIGISGEPAMCKVRLLGLTGKQLRDRLAADHHRGETNLAENLPVPADILLSFSGLAGTDSRNPLTPILFGLRVVLPSGVSLIASRYSVDAKKRSTARLIRTDLNGAINSRSRQEFYRTTHTLSFENDPYDAVAIVDSYCVWRVSPGPSLEHDTISVLLKLLPSSNIGTGVRDSNLSLIPFIAPITTVTTASSTAPIPRFSGMSQAANLLNDQTEWTIEI